MFGVKDINAKEKMKGVLMNHQSSLSVKQGFDSFQGTMNPFNRGLQYSGDFDSVENFLSSPSSFSSSSSNFMHPFNSSMHPDVRSLPRCVDYELGLSQNLAKMDIADGFLTAGYPDPGPFSESVDGFDIYGFDEYLKMFEQDSMEPLPFSSYPTAIGRRSESFDYAYYDMMQRKGLEQGRGFFDSGVRFHEPCNRFYNRGSSSSQIVDPRIGYEYDTMYDQQMHKKGGQNLQCYEGDLLHPSLFPCVPKPEESYENNYFVDGICSKGALGKNSKYQKGFKNKAREVISLHKEKPVSDSISDCGENLVSGLGHEEVEVMHRYLSQLKGSLCMVAKHQLGCRFLQKVFDQGSSEDAAMIFDEAIHDVQELILDPFGNYLIQKMLESCTEEQKLRIVLALTKRRGELVSICFSSHGTRVVQKLIESIKSTRQIALVMIALKPGLVELMKDSNGNHVVQKCLQCHTNEQNKFVFDTAAKFCIDIACDRFGCCVVNRCICYSSGKLREKFVVAIAGHGLLLAQNDFGNYVIQQIIELKIPLSIATLLSQFEGHYVQLSMQKFSSHVIEKCLRCIKESRFRIMKELLSVRHFDQLLQDRFANYVIQSALQVTKGSPSLHAMLVEAIRPYQGLRSSPYCKKLFTNNLCRQ